MAKQYWLMKTEPTVFSIDDLMEVKSEPWEGIRNYQVRNMLRDDLKKGDLALCYHSNSKPSGVAGVMEVVKEGYPDYFAWDKKSKYFDIKSDPENPRWFMVDVKFKEKFSRIVSLTELKEENKLSEMKVVQRGCRLSIMKIKKVEFDHIIKLSKKSVK